MGNGVDQSFDAPGALALNEARLQHLASLSLNLENRTVLEVGAGVGLLTGFFEERGCVVLATDGRANNVEEHKRRHPHRDVRVFDLGNPAEYKRFEPHEIVFCYGTLYHLPDPALCLERLAGLCTSLFLLETMVYGPNDNVVMPTQDPTYDNQSLHGGACRPGRNWILRELERWYGHVYLVGRQPEHPEFPTTWPGPVDNARAVFVGSREELAL